MVSKGRGSQRVHMEVSCVHAQKHSIVMPRIRPCESSSPHMKTSPLLSDLIAPSTCTPPSGPRLT